MGTALEIVSVGRVHDITDDLLRDRAARGWRDAWTHGFVARIDRKECGLLMLDIYDRTLPAKVYEIFVLKEFRQHRVGSGLLKHAEVSAKEFGAIRLWLEVHSLDPELDDAWLRQWYSSHGFIEAAEPSVMEKDLQNTANQSASEA